VIRRVIKCLFCICISW